jgi:hypothetical protein
MSTQIHLEKDYKKAVRETTNKGTGEAYGKCQWGPAERVKDFSPMSMDYKLLKCVKCPGFIALPKA